MALHSIEARRHQHHVGSELMGNGHHNRPAGKKIKRGDHYYKPHGNMESEEYRFADLDLLGWSKEEDLRFYVHFQWVTRRSRKPVCSASQMNGTIHLYESSMRRSLRENV